MHFQAALKNIVIKVILVGAASLALSCTDTEAPEMPPKGRQDTSQTDTTVARDTIPPAAITDAFLSIAESTLEVTLEWTAPHDDSLNEPVSAYKIRYSSSRFAIEAWDLGMPIFDAPKPGLPGFLEHYTGFDRMVRGYNLYAAVKSVDEAGNISPASNIASVYIPGYSLRGACSDVYSRIPIADLSVVLTSNKIYTMQTDEQGTFSKDDLPQGLVHMDVTSQDAHYHAFHEKINISSDSTTFVFMIPFEPVHSSDYHSLLQLFKIITKTTSSNLTTTLHKWRKTPIKCYIPPFINANGIDYELKARQAAQRWMDASNWQLFDFVDAPPDTGIIVEYKTKEQMKNQIGITYHTDGPDSLPLLDSIYIVDSITDPGFTYRVFLHEFGHAIRFGHVSTAEYIMYFGQPLPDDISDDEIAVLRLLKALPNNTNMGMYQDTPP